MKEQEYFNEKLVESAEINVDVDETHKERIKALTKIFKFAFGQPVSDFKQILDYAFYVNGVPKAESQGKLEKVIVNFITAIRYFTYLGMDEEKINRQMSNYGITINRTDWSPVGGDKANQKKYLKAWSDLYPNDDPMNVDDSLLKFLLDEGVKSKFEILVLKDEVETISEHVEERCEVLKSSFKSGVNLKTMILKQKDIGDKVAKIEKKADEVSQIIERLG